MASLLRSAAVAPIARSAVPRAALRAPLVATPSRHTFSTTAYLSNSPPPGKGAQQSPRKNEDQVKEARQASRSILYFSLAAAGLVAGIFSFTRLSAEGQGPQAKRLSYAERVKASLAKSNEKGGVEAFHKAAGDIDGEDSPTSGEGTDAADVAAQQGPSSSSSSSTSASAGLETISQVVEDDPGEGQEAAYDPSTGQINWDCPCLGGMATGPCGEEFKEAFSCFVFSEAEPKGVECVGKFKGMQDCFRRHPEEYKEELEMEEEDESNSLIDEVEHALGLGGRGGESNQQVAA